MTQDTRDLKTFEAWSDPGAWSPRQRKIVAGIVLTAVLVPSAAVIFLSLSDERERLLFDLAVAAIVSVALCFGGRGLLRAEAARRSRLIAAEMIGVAVGGAIVGAVGITLASKPLGPANVLPLVVIQGLGAVCGGVIVALPAFFLAAGVKFGTRIAGRSMPEKEAAFIGLASGLFTGIVAAAVMRLGPWFPFFAAAVCGWTAYRGLMLHRRFEAAA